MRRSVVIFCLLAIAAIICLSLLHHRQSKTETPLVVTSQPVAVQTNTPISTPANGGGGIAALSAPAQMTNNLSFEEKRVETIKKSLEEGKSDWRTPIEFYGRVIDDSNNAISGAKIDFSCNDLSPSGTSYYYATSDANGGFSITGIQGKLLQVSVSKAGYYSYDPAGQFFYYAGQNQNFVADIGNPVVFKLREIGAGAKLFHIHSSFPIPKDGSPVFIDLATGETGAQNGTSFKVECLTHDETKVLGWQFDWQCHITVPGGGLQTNNDLFPFQAPNEGYQMDEQIVMKAKDNPEWSQDVKRNYYVKTGDGHFARMNFRMIAHGDHFCQIDSFLNMDGTQNLEPQSQ
jgi:hypothetical protein